MFFNDILVKNKILRPVWRAGNSLNEGSDENTSLSIICSKLDQWVGSNSMDASRRLSLRTSAILIDGAAKLYKKEMEQLIEDVAKLDEEMILRNRRDATDFEKDTSITTSRSYDTPEQMMRRTEIHPDISFEAPTRNPTISPPTLHRNHSFISYTSTPSPPKRQREEFIHSGSPKKRVTNSEKSIVSTPYPWSDKSYSDIEIKSLDSSDRQTDHNEKGDRTESVRSNDSRSEIQSKNSDQSSRQGSSTQLNSDSEQRTENSVQQNSDMIQLESLKCSREKRSSSPTFTEIIDTGLPIDRETLRPDRQTDVQNATFAEEKTHDRNDNSNVRANEKSSDHRTAIEYDQGSQASHTSIILKTTKKSHSKLRRNKKGPKPIKIVKDQATQAVSFPPGERDNISYSERLPFAYLLIHDSYHSRFPSKIVISSLNKDINNLVCL